MLDLHTAQCGAAQQPQHDARRRFTNVGQSSLPGYAAAAWGADGPRGGAASGHGGGGCAAPADDGPCGRARADTPRRRCCTTTEVISSATKQAAAWAAAVKEAHGLAG